MADDKANFFHRIDWAPGQVQRFWDHYSSTEQSREVYFGRMFGDAVLDVCERSGILADPIADVGCGPGHFVRKLLSRGHSCLAVDSSRESITAVRSLDTGEGKLLLAETGGIDQLPIEDGGAGTAFLIEVIEHLTADLAAAALEELRRILRPGGRLVVTTPYDEDLSHSEIGCPNCGAVFHKMQHVRSFTIESLSAELTAAGFKMEQVANYNFGREQLPAWRRAVGATARFVGLRKPLSRPHLLAIARV